MDTPSFAELLRQHRLGLGLTQEELAERAGMSARGVQDLERGLNHAPRASTLRLLVCGLRLSDSDAAALMRAAKPGRPDHPAAEARGRHNLPLPTTSFVARAGELGQLEQRMSCSRLVTLTGAGGCGKTRLALEVGHAHVDLFADGVWLIELASVADASLIPQSIATTLGIPSGNRRPPAETLIEYLGSRRVLLLLDNCEHLVDACADIVDRLLRVCVRLQILATSREALRVPGEAVWRVGSLSLADPDGLARPSGVDTVAKLLEAEAAQLFVDRARLVAPSFAITARNASAVARICQRLDGIPLAIELATARLPVLSVEQLADRLPHRLDLLAGGYRTASHRQQTLHATIDWSYKLLPDAERSLLRRLAVFAGGWSLEAAEALALDRLQAGEEVVEQLGTLVAKSMVLVEEPPRAEPGSVRYHCLEPIRQFAEEHLVVSGEAAAARARHCKWYLSLAEQAWDGVQGSDPQRWLQRLDLEHDNLLAALSWSAADPNSVTTLLRLAGSLGPYWQARGLLVREGIGWLETALDHSDATPSADRARALDWLAQLEAGSGNVGRLNLLEQSVAEARAVGDRRLLAMAVSHLGQALLSIGRLAEARGSLEEALAVSRAANLPREVASSQCWLGVILIAVGRLDAAEALLLESVALGRQTGHESPVAWSLRALGELYRARGDLARGRSAAVEGLAIARRIETDLWLVSLLLLTLGDLDAADGDWATARSWYRQCLQQVGRTAPLLLAETLRRYAASCAARGDFLSGARCYGAASNAAAHAWSLVYAPPTRDEDVVSRMREALGEARFAAAWAEGASRTLEEAIADILA
jgi:non-specific serine/threonine protein kinase